MLILKPVQSHQAMDFEILLLEIKALEIFVLIFGNFLDLIKIHQFLVEES